MTRAHSPLTHTREREREGALARARARVGGHSFSLAHDLHTCTCTSLSFLPPVLRVTPSFRVSLIAARSREIVGFRSAVNKRVFPFSFLPFSHSPFLYFLSLSFLVRFHDSRTKRRLLTLATGGIVEFLLPPLPFPHACTASSQSFSRRLADTSSSRSP